MMMQSIGRGAILVASAAVFLGFLEPLRAQPKEPAGPVESEVLKLEAELNQAVVTGDLTVFDRLFADDFTHTSQNGRFRTKAQWMKGKQPGQSSYVSFDVAETCVRVFGDSAVVTGVSSPVWREEDRTTTGRFRFVRVWTKRKDGWQVVAFQATNVEAESPAASPKLPLDEPVATKSFEVRNDRAFLAGNEIKLWGIRCGNALMTQAVTERHVRNLDNMAEHGINCIGVYLQGSNGGWPDAEAGVNGYAADGALKHEFAERLEWLVREADRRGMVVMVGLFSPRKDQEFADEAAVQRACEETAKFLSERLLKNVFVDLMHEYNHERIDMDLFREPEGEAKKAKLTRWFKKFAPDIEAGVCPTFKSGTGDSFAGMEVRLIQKEHPIPTSGFVVNVEMQRHDPYENDGKFEREEFDVMNGYFRAYKAAPNAALLFHSAFIQGITNKSGTAPHPEMGGYGQSEQDRGVRFYYDWVRDNVGRWEYPRHVKISR